MYNYKHIETTCPECNNEDILHDPLHEETFCTHCGLIIHDATIPRITMLIREYSKEASTSTIFSSSDKMPKKSDMQFLYLYTQP